MVSNLIRWKELQIATFSPSTTYKKFGHKVEKERKTWKKKFFRSLYYNFVPVIPMKIRIMRHKNLLTFILFLLTTFTGFSQVADFSASPTTICAGGSVSFTNLSVGATTYTWTFPDGGAGQFSSLANPSITYPNPGTFTVILTAYTGAVNSDTETKNAYITVIAAATATLTSAVGTDNQTLCAGDPLANITYDLVGASGATFSGLPPGVNGSVTPNPSGGSVLISGTPSTPGIYNYSFTTTLNSCAPITVNGTITVGTPPTITLTSGNPTQAICMNSPITPIVYAIGGTATSASVSGLPAGLSGTFFGGNLTISGTPTQSGLFPFTVTTSGGVCPPATLNGTLDVNPNITSTLTSAVGTDNQTVCSAGAITNITYTLNGASSAIFSGLPPGVTALVVPTSTGATITISGTPTTPGTYNYSFTTSSTACPAITVNGTITVGTPPTITLTSGNPNQVLCVNNAITPIVYTIGGAATSASVSGLPAGLSGIFSGGTLTISGTPTQTGNFPFTVSTIGGVCPPAALNGVINVDPYINLISAPGTDNQIVCANSAIVNIVYALGAGFTGATIDTLPPGINGVFSPGSFVISGSSSQLGTVFYTITTQGGSCGPATASGSITITAGPILNLTSAPFTDNQTVCEGSPIVQIDYTIGGSATGAIVSSLPLGLSSSFVGGTLSISGTSNAVGVYPYTVTTTGSTCGNISLNGTITIEQFPSIQLLSPNPTDSQQVCINSVIDSIIYQFSGSATGALGLNLPFGVGVNTQSDTVIVSGIASSPGTYDFQIFTTGGTCVADTAYGQIIVDDSLGLQLLSALGTDNQVLCDNGNPIDTVLYTFTGGADTIVVTGLPPGVVDTFYNDTLQITGVPTASGTFTYSMVVSGGFCPNDTLTGTIEVQTAQLVLLSDPFTNDQLICLNKAIDSIVYSVGGPVSIQDLPPGVTGTYVPGAPNLLIITGTPTATGSYHYTLQFNGPCGTSLAVGYITVAGGVQNFIAGPDTTINLGQSVDLFALGDNVLNYSWTPDSTLSNAIIFNPVSTPNVTTTYTVTVEDDHGCIASLPVTVTVLSEIELFVPNLFSPNGDNYNDTWEIPNLSLFPNTGVTIINREGQIVYENSAYDNTWDGTYEGKKLPEATYYYLIKFSSTSQLLKGAVTILRNGK